MAVKPEPLDYASARTLGEANTWRARYPLVLQIIGIVLSLLSWLIWSGLWMWVLAVVGLSLYLIGLSCRRRSI